MCVGAPMRKGEVGAVRHVGGRELQARRDSWRKPAGDKRWEEGSRQNPVGRKLLGWRSLSRCTFVTSLG